MNATFVAVPYPFGREYHCLVVLANRGNVDALVIEPDLRTLAGGKKLPHVYSFNGKGTKLCLYRPLLREWSSNLHLCQTIVPWIYEWLRYYELWLVTGEWEGGGEHPEAGEAPK